jgi:hypothetical protein
MKLASRASRCGRSCSRASWDQFLARSRAWAVGAAPPRAVTPRRRLLLLIWGGFALPQVPVATGARGRRTAYAAHAARPIGTLGGAIPLRGSAARAVALVLGTPGASLVVIQDDLRPDLGDAFGDVLWQPGTPPGDLRSAVLERHDGARLLAAVALTALAAREQRIIDPDRAPPRCSGYSCWRRPRPRSSPGSEWAHCTRAVAMGVLIFVQPGRAHRGHRVLGERTARWRSSAALILGGNALRCAVAERGCRSTVARRRRELEQGVGSCAGSALELDLQRFWR